MADYIKTVTCDSYFNSIGAVSAGSGGSCPVITSFKVGYGWVDEAGETPILTDLNGTETNVPGIFFTGTKADLDMTVSYSGGTLLMQCVVAEGSVSEPEKASAIGIFDQNGNMIAAAAFYPDWITPTEEYRINVYINFPVFGD
jgi:hypothetical protein